MDLQSMQAALTGSGGALVMLWIYAKDKKDELVRMRGKEDARTEAGDKMLAQVIETLTMSLHVMGEVKDLLEEVKSERKKGVENEGG